ncbi:hypothetical protein TSUD_54120 [Trifolium subterraneum]|uniref:Integrase catalytic domain-containing protein n=1 Tax=Trifolium subterraneum TaxID=3900 RepID=A0A2Z6NIS5_TRISU|nr:hypothetical protein TSUD_54120 [Trifolium subterraneum]
MTSSSLTLDDLATTINNLVQSQQAFQTNISTNIDALAADVNTLRTRMGPPGFTFPHNADPPPFPTTSIKLDIPRFDGSDPLGWIFKITQFFDYHRTPDEQRLRVASFYMEGEALTWFRWMHQNDQLLTWTTFLHALEIRFAPSQYEDLKGALFKLSQTSSVKEYQTQFESLANRIVGLSPSCYLSCFVSGLKPEIRHEVLGFQPVTLTQAISLAKLQEEKLADRPLSTPKPQASISASSTQREKGLCYNCDEKFQRGHRCKRLFHLRIVEPDDSPEEASSFQLEGNQPEPTMVEETSLDLGVDVDPTQISLHALMGQLIPQTLRVMGQIHHTPVAVLKDSGRPIMFLQDRVARQLGLRTEPAHSFRVLVGNAEELQCTTLCPQIPLLLGSHQFTVDLFVLPISGAELVLGVQWLKTLGPIITDYDKLTMSFCKEGQQVLLTGVPKASPEEANIHQLQRLLSTNAIDTFFHLQLLHPESTTPSLNHQDSRVTELLHKFQTLFQTPTHLPPQRPVEHQIPLLPNTNPVNVRPYRYHHFQKREIEIQIKEMLANGLIRPSSSSFSSPVLLVRKKNDIIKYEWIKVTFTRPLSGLPRPLRISESKCLIAQPSIEYLGHVVTAEGVGPGPSKIEAMVNWPTPKYVKQLRGFLGLTGFYRKFVCKYASINAPLTQLLKRDAFDWNHEVDQAFVALKKAMSEAPVLSLPNFEEKFILETDASGTGMGAVLIQQNHPICYFSNQFFPRMVQASTYVRELCAITTAIKKWRTYLLGNTFIIYTDQRSLRELMTQVIQTPEQQFYLAKLLGYSYEIVYKPGPQNRVADALSPKVADLFAKMVCKLLGIPKSIVSDRDPIFLSNFWKELFRLNGTKLRMSTAYHPQSDGQTEVVNKILQQYLRCFVHDKRKLWSQFLHWAEWHYNTTLHTSTGLSPYQVVYGRAPPTLNDYIPGTSKLQAVDAIMNDREAVLELLKNKLLKAQTVMKYADQRRIPHQFNVGDSVFVKLRPYRQNSVLGRRFHKLSKRYYGPFKLIRAIGDVAFELELPSTSRIHPVFHVSQLKPYFSDTEVSLNLPSDTIDNQPCITPKVILDWRMTEEDEQLEVLVQWEGLLPEDSTWDNYQELQNAYPVFDLDDMVNFDGIGDVMDQNNMDPDWDDAEREGEPTSPMRAKRKCSRPKYLNDFVVASLKKGGKK